MIRKILLVDDDRVLQLSLRRKLAKFDEEFQVVEAVDGFDALKKLEKAAFSLVCTDLMMPRMDGMSLISHIRTKYPDLPVIIISGILKKDVPNIEQVDGLLAYLGKPFKANKLLEVILTTLKEEAKEGVMHNVSPTMFLQLMEMEGKTCTIRMLDNASDEGGVLYLTNGRLLDARVGGLTGMKAATRVFFWNEVTVFLRHECVPMENVINSDIQPIIMAALVAKDEYIDALSHGREADSASLDRSSGVGTEVNDPLVDMLDDARMTGGNPEGAKNAALNDLREFIEKELGDTSTISAIYRDESVIKTNSSLENLGVLSGLGALKAGRFEKEEGGSTLFIPGNPPTLLDIKKGSPVTDLFTVLKKRT